MSTEALDPREFRPTGRFQILALDGGGIKGIFSAAVLAKVEEDLKINVVDHFDMIAGTSTGGILAIGLGLGIKPRELLNFYVKHGPEIFKSIWGYHKTRHIFRNKYSSIPLEAALQKHFLAHRFGDSRKRLVIPSFNVGEDETYLFRTPHLEKLSRDYRVPAWHVAMATSAAPTYFPAARHVDNQRLIDGGVWANNPSMVALVEAHGQLKVPLDQIHICSIGTSDPVNSRSNRLNRGGQFRWRHAAVDVILRGQSIGVNNQVKFLIGKDNVLRLDPRVPPDIFALDGITEAAALISKAAHHSRDFAQSFRERFAGHRAPQYIPWH